MAAGSMKNEDVGASVVLQYITIIRNTPRRLTRGHMRCTLSHLKSHAARSDHTDACRAPQEEKRSGSSWPLTWLAGLLSRDDFFGWAWTCCSTCKETAAHLMLDPNQAPEQLEACSANSQQAAQRPAASVRRQQAAGSRQQAKKQAAG